jgi:hypothetical protein
VIVHDAPQGTPEWAAIRAAKPTASKFGVLMTAEARKGKLTVGAHTYMVKLLAEWVLGKPLDDGASGGFIARGTSMEPEGRAWYSFTRDVEIQQIGFITRDDGRCGCSLDGTVGSDGTIEVKCYGLEDHIAALLEADDSHLPQIQGGLWISERQWCDRIYYSPCLPPVVARVYRDEPYIAQLAASVEAFLGHFEKAKAKLVELGAKPAARQTHQEAPGSTQADDLAFDKAWAADADPAPPKHDRAVELAAAFRALPVPAQFTLGLEYMLSDGDDLARSIEGLTPSMMDELNAAIGLERAGI